MHVIEFDTEGKAECLHTDAFPLGEIGTLKMERASTIEWNERTQLWEVRMVHSDGSIQTGIAPFMSGSREDCLAWEREYFNGEILSR